MILFFKSFLNTFMTLSWIDLVFFAAVLFLIILIVSLIYFIMINNDEETKGRDFVVKEENKEITPLDNTGNTGIFDNYDDPNEQGELLDLQAITKKIEERKNSTIELTDYETEQEEKAIISYDELIAKKNDYKINYEDEENIGDLTIKKVDLENLKESLKEDYEPIKIPVKVISYEKEEAFLEALKKLQEQIN